MIPLSYSTRYYVKMIKEALNPHYKAHYCGTAYAGFVCARADVIIPQLHPLKLMQWYFDI